MNNVGEAFFSSPIDPSDSAKDWGRSDDDQRHRLVVNGSVNSPMAPATTAWEHVSHGFQLGGMLQDYSAPALQHHLGPCQFAGTDGTSARRRRNRIAELRRPARHVYSAQRGNRQRLLRAEPPPESRVSDHSRREA